MDVLAIMLRPSCPISPCAELPWASSARAARAFPPQGLLAVTPGGPDEC
jgi:hypothetical protein